MDHSDIEKKVTDSGYEADESRKSGTNNSGVSDFSSGKSSSGSDVQ